MNYKPEVRFFFFLLFKKALAQVCFRVFKVISLNLLLMCLLIVFDVLLYDYSIFTYEDAKGDDHPSKVLWIGCPPSVRIDEQLLHNARILFGEIRGQSNFFCGVRIGLMQ